MKIEYNNNNLKIISKDELLQMSYKDSLIDYRKINDQLSEQSELLLEEYEYQNYSVSSNNNSSNNNNNKKDLIINYLL